MKATRNQMKVITIMFLFSIHMQAQPGRFRDMAAIPDRPMSFEVANEAHYNKPCFLKNQSTQQALSRQVPEINGHPIVMDGITGQSPQKFIFTDAGRGEYFIQTSTGSYLTADANHSPSLYHRGLIEPELSERRRFRPGGPESLLDTEHDRQKWAIRRVNNNGLYRISNKANPGLSLTHTSANQNSPELAATDSRAENQIWIIVYFPFNDNPNSADADAGLVYDCNYEFPVYRFFQKEKDVARLLPEWRTIGETTYPDAEITKLVPNFKVLEGTVVASSPPHIASEDFPTTHYTHDFDFFVDPDPLFDYLRGKENGSIQPYVPVEWESGIGQGHHSTNNPAVRFNKIGDSFGFFSSGHKRYDEIWNWPSPNDWVHVEGNWIWDRGHEDPIKSEIHPAHFIGIKRYLPERLIITGNEFVYSTRCDIYANGDGNVLWNNKGLNNFAQHVHMSKKVFIVSFTQDLPRPNNRAKLRYQIIDQIGNTYEPDGQVIVFEDGSPENPKPHITWILKWPEDLQPDNTVYAKSIFLYWDDIITHGVSSGYPIRPLRITLDSITILDKGEGHDRDAGEYRLFAAVGNRWYFLNEFVPSTNIITEGLGDAWDIFYSRTHPLSNGAPYPQPSNTRSFFDFDLVQTVYVPAGKEAHVLVCGWEGDYIENEFGQIVNPYLNCDQAIDKYGEIFSGSDYCGQGGQDDPVGMVVIAHNFNDQIPMRYAINSAGETTTSEVTDTGCNIGQTNPDDSYLAVVRIE